MMFYLWDLYVFLLLVIQLCIIAQILEAYHSVSKFCVISLMIFYQMRPDRLLFFSECSNKEKQTMIEQCSKKRMVLAIAILGNKVRTMFYKWISFVSETSSDIKGFTYFLGGGCVKPFLHTTPRCLPSPNIAQA